MSTEEILVQALETIGIPVKYYLYEGAKPEYFVYNEEVEQQVNFGDNKPLNTITWWQAHLFAPKNSEFRKYKKEAVKAVRDAGFNVTDIRTLFEKETKTIHVTISCHMEERED